MLKGREGVLGGGGPSQPPFEHDDIDSSLGQPQGGDRPAKPAPDDQGVDHLAARRRLCPALTIRTDGGDQARAAGYRDGTRGAKP
jgi:hypothetical protein